MNTLDISLTDSELVSEVRDAMAGLDGTKIPDGTIEQTAQRMVIPLLNDITGNLDASDQQSFDSAAIAWTAELSFSAWMTFSRLRDAEVEAYVDPAGYKSTLEERTNLALRLLGATRPPEIPNYHVTVKHEGVNRKIDLQQIWVEER